MQFKKEQENYQHYKSSDNKTNRAQTNLNK
jgi:hypothetical protein